MGKNKVAKIWFGFTALSVLVIVPFQLFLSATNSTGLYQYGWERFLNTLAFFTIQSNILVGVISFILFKNIQSNSRISSVLQFGSLICIFVTGVVYHLLLAGEANLEGIEVITDLFLHTIIPLLYVIGWMIFVPRGNATHRVSLYALLIPVIWSVFTLLKGPLVGFYPYPFMDVIFLGYAKALINMMVITLLFFIIAYGFHKYDEILVKR